jgi:2,3-bisphosphoglycerate-dependent phosphoglycerate mutase
MQFYYVRHAQSENNLLWATDGPRADRSQDPELTQTGEAQAEQLAHFLSRGPGAPPDAYDPHNLEGFGITHLYCSLMIRAVVTGTYVAEALGIPLVARCDLHETGGIFVEGEDGEPQGRPGKPRSYFERHYPDLVLPDALDEDGWWNRSFEDHEERQARAEHVAEWLLSEHGETDHRVALVSHGGFYNHLLAALLNWERGDDYWFLLNNAAITRIDVDPETHTTSVIYTNRVDFLSPELVT